MSTSTFMQSYNGAETVLRALPLVQDSEKLALVLTTRSGTCYMIRNLRGQLVACRKEHAVRGQRIDPGDWRMVYGRIEAANIHGSMQIGHWTTTSVVKVELKEPGRDGGRVTIWER